jgi:hypothetical protein
MKKVDFRKIMCENVDGEVLPFDIAGELGNMLYMRGMNIEECELGRTIYKTSKLKPDDDTAVELSDEQVKIVRRYMAQFPMFLRKGLEKQLS